MRPERHGDTRSSHRGWIAASLRLNPQAVMAAPKGTPLPSGRPAVLIVVIIIIVFVFVVLASLLAPLHFRLGVLLLF